MRIGQQLGQYLITAPLGEGAMGQVFRGRDTQLNRDVAIKVLRPEISSRPDLVERFRNEAMTLASLHHGNICSVYAFAEHDGRHAMVLQHLEGESLEDVLKTTGRFTWPDARQVLRDVLSGLEEAHAAGIVHRDLKPANLMVTPSRKVVIMDFGIARVKNQQRATREGMMVGTLEYASPEQIRGEDVDARSDLYSLGMIAYEMLLGRLPFNAKTDYDWVKAQTQEVPSYAELSDLHGKQVASFLRKVLEKAPEKRYGSAADMKAALDGVGTGSKPSFPTIRLPSLPSAASASASVSLPVALPWLKENIVMAVSAAFVLLGVGFVALTHLGSSGTSGQTTSGSVPANGLLVPVAAPSSQASMAPASSGSSVATPSAPVAAPTQTAARSEPTTAPARPGASSLPGVAPSQTPVTTSAASPSPASTQISTGVEVERPLTIAPLSTPEPAGSVQPAASISRNAPAQPATGWSARSGTKN